MNDLQLVKAILEGLYIYFKPSMSAPKGSGLLFAILNKTMVDVNHFDTVGEPRNIKANDVDYIVGGPTDLGFPEDHKEFKDYATLKKQVSQVVKTIKVANIKVSNN